MGSASCCTGSVLVEVAAEVQDRSASRAPATWTWNEIDAWVRRDFRPPCSSRRYTHGKDLMSGIVRLYLSSATQGHNTLYPQVFRENYKTTGLTIRVDSLGRQKLVYMIGIDN